MSRNYYFLASLLPEIQLEAPIELSLHELNQLLQTNLAAEDMKQVEVLRRYCDIENFRAHLQDRELSTQGNWGEVELEGQLVTQESLPQYFIDFLERYEEPAEQLHHFPALVAAYFREEGEHATGFLHALLQEERNSRLVLAALRAKDLGRDIAHELQYEEEGDDLVAQILAQKDAPHYSPPARYEHLAALFAENGANPLGMAQALNYHLFAFIDEQVEGDFFGIDSILAYMSKVMLAERWLQLDPKQGMQIVDSLSKDTP